MEVVQNLLSFSLSAAMPRPAEKKLQKLTRILYKRSALKNEHAPLHTWKLIGSVAPVRQTCGRHVIVLHGHKFPSYTTAKDLDTDICAIGGCFLGACLHNFHLFSRGPRKLSILGQCILLNKCSRLR